MFLLQMWVNGKLCFEREAFQNVTNYLRCNNFNIKQGVLDPNELLA